VIVGRYIEREDGVYIPAALWKQTEDDLVDEIDIVARFNSQYESFHHEETRLNISGRLSFKYVVLHEVRLIC
jgi:hypothetical protein